MIVTDYNLWNKIGTHDFILMRVNKTDKRCTEVLDDLCKMLLPLYRIEDRNSLVCLLLRTYSPFPNILGKIYNLLP